MAGGSQILIDSQGVTVTTNGKVVFKAGQHVFEGGERVVTPVTILPTAPNDYSHKVNYKFSYTDGNGQKIDPPENIQKQVFVIENATKKLLAQRILNNSIEDTTLRFHTAEVKHFTALLFNSENIMMDKPNDPFFNEEEVGNEPSLDGVFQISSDE